MGSRVIVVVDPRPPLARWLREGYMHTQGGGRLKMVGVPHCMVGGYVETRGGGAEGDQ